MSRNNPTGATEETLKYACPECGCLEFVSSPDSYSVYKAEGDSLRFKCAETIEAEMDLHCRECGEEVPVEFLEAARISP